MREFTDSQGNTYSEQELSSLDSMPDYTSFNTLDLRGTTVTKLPKKLTVFHELDLSDSQVEELPSDLAVGRLDLSWSKVKHIPTGVHIDKLYLAYSMVTSIGTGLSVSDLYIDSTDNLTNLIQCRQCQIDPKRGTKELDLRNVKMNGLSVIEGDCRFLIKNAKADSFFISQIDNRPVSQFALADSEFQTLEVKIQNGSSLEIRDCQIKVMEVISKHYKELSLDLSIRQANIENLTCSGPLSGLKIRELSLFGSLVIKNVIGAPVLPERGIVYGDLGVPKGFYVPP